MQPVVDQALMLIAQADEAVVDLVDGDQLTYACAAGKLAERVELRLAMDASLSGLAVTTGENLYSPDAAVDPRVEAEACRAVGVVRLVCLPLGRGSERDRDAEVNATHAGHSRARM